jgi:transposase
MAEAVQRPRMRFVPIKTEEQLDLQALHRVRERWVMRRTAVVNQIRSLLLERGLTLPKGRRHVDQALPRILEDAELKLSGSFRVLLAQLQLEQRLPRGIRVEHVEPSKSDGTEWGVISIASNQTLRAVTSDSSIKRTRRRG